MRELEAESPEYFINCVRMEAAMFRKVPILLSERIRKKIRFRSSLEPTIKLAITLPLLVEEHILQFFILEALCFRSKNVVFLANHLASLCSWSSVWESDIGFSFLAVICVSSTVSGVGVVARSRRYLRHCFPV